MALDQNAPPWEWDTRALLQAHFDTRTSSHPSDRLKLCMPASGCGSPESSGTPFSTASPPLAAIQASASGKVRACFQKHVLPIVSGPNLTNEALTLDWSNRNGGCKGPCTQNDAVVSSFGDSGEWAASMGFLELGSHASNEAVTTDMPIAETSEGENLTHINEDISFTKQHEKQTSETSYADYVGVGALQSSRAATGSASSGDSSIGLHLGKRTYFQDAAGTRAKGAHTSFDTVLKKARASASTSRPPRCQVDRCETDLTSAKEYHRRHKVCELHSKAGKVIVAKQEKRFCQQCSRFHLLLEFDDTKRSCRRRLANHNERRRKPQIDTSLTDSQFLHPTLSIWPILHHPKFFSLSSTAGSSSCTLSQPYLLQSGRYDHTLQAGAINQTSSNGLKMMSNDIASSQTAQPILGHMASMGSNLTLPLSSSSSLGILGAFPRFEFTPVRQPVTRVSDSGRALSLLSLPTQAEYHVSDVVGSRDMTNGIVLDQLMNEDLMSERCTRQNQVHSVDLHTCDKLLSMDTSIYADGLMCSMSNTTNTVGVLDSNEKTFMHGLSMGGGVGFDNDLCLAALHEQRLKGNTEEVKETIDLMPDFSFQPRDAQLDVGIHFQTSSPLDLHYTYGSSFF